MIKVEVISKSAAADSTEKSLSSNQSDFSPTEAGFEMTEDCLILKTQNDI